VLEAALVDTTQVGDPEKAVPKLITLVQLLEGAEPKVTLPLVSVLEPLRVPVVHVPPKVGLAPAFVL